MALISLSNVGVAYGPDDILESISCDANAGERIGLVGRNGAGKTTLLRVLAGSERPTTGQRSAARYLRYALVEQIPPLAHAERTVREEVLSPLEDVIALDAALQEAGAAMAAGDAEAAETYSALLHRMEAEGAFTLESRFAQIAGGLGLDESDWDRPLAKLSGGQRGRVGLARALIAAPDLLLMDEPTNHLDLYGLRWLEGFLAKWQGTVIVTSHDRYFLDKVATRIWHVENRRLRSYPGNYSKFEELREADLARAEREFTAQQEFIAREEAFIRRYGAGQRAAEAQGRLKRLNRLERLEAHREQRAVSFNLKAARSGEVVVRTRDLVAGYGETPVLRAGDLELERGARVALVGRNGSGKSTLLKTIAGELRPLTGTLRLGSNVTFAHYWQEAEGLAGNLMVLDELLRDDSLRIQEARDLAGRFLFSGDDVLKRVGDLSGGERSRLALAKLVRSGANLLLLDEPTNHLDIPSREALEEALLSFTGTIVFASHDRRLISQLATALWVIENGALKPFNGNLEDLERAEAAVAEPLQPLRATPPARDTTTRRLSAHRRAELLASLEAQIEAQEAEIAELGDVINRASAAGDVAQVGDLGRRFETLTAEHNELLQRWADLG
ncbi:MAG TPA: ABC-F family ATP-binding cassette domain-containing protein [Dehalococcoidia bacterium]|nr:ABC-F family ATP-binding cassette domain-containing protein [Dehalococcoidia bacterium]